MFEKKEPNRVSRSNKHFKHSIVRSCPLEYCNFLQSSDTIGKIILYDTKHIILAFDKRFTENKFENNSQILFDTASEVNNVDLCFPEYQVYSNSIGKICTNYILRLLL